MSDQDKRYDVQVKNGDYEDVGAESVDFTGGVAAFRDSSGEVLVAYAPGEWILVTGQGAKL